jgi:hypothetical protein
MPVPEPSRPTTPGPRHRNVGARGCGRAGSRSEVLRDQLLAHEGVSEDLGHAGADVLERADPAPR